MIFVKDTHTYADETEGKWVRRSVFALIYLSYVVVRVRVGKEFADMKQNEREIVY